MSTAPVSSAGSATARTAPVANTRSWPVLLCAGLAVPMIAFSLYVWVKWLLSDDFGPVDPGPDPISLQAEIALRCLEIGGAGLTVWLYYRFAWLPWRRNGRLNGDGLILLAAPLVWFWDPFFNYTQTVFIYNAHLLDFGSWSSQVPTWIAPNHDNFAEPISVGLSYVFWVFGFMVLAGALMDRLRRRFPAMSTATFILGTFLICFVLNTIGEVVGLLIGWFSYPGVWGATSVFEDTRWKMSLFSPLFGGLQMFLWVGLWYWRDDKGYTLVERGVDSVAIGDRGRTVLRFLALYTGMTAAVFAVNLGFNFQALHSSSFPRETPSYLTTTCPKADEAPDSCGGPGIPIPRRDGD